MMSDGAPLCLLAQVKNRLVVPCRAMPLQQTYTAMHSGKAVKSLVLVAMLHPPSGLQELLGCISQLCHYSLHVPMTENKELQIKLCYEQRGKHKQRGVTKVVKNLVDHLAQPSIYTSIAH